MLGDWGPFDEHISHTERIARLRVLRAAVVGLGRQHRELIAALKAAEAEPAELLEAADQFEKLPTILKRKLMAFYLEVG
jgi:hypothetical protein